LEKITYEANLRINMKKSKFFKTEARILRTIASRTGLKMDPKKIEVIVNWPRPMIGKTMQRFMGAANFHREFSSEFARIAAPLNECRSVKKIEWTNIKIGAFEKLKKLFQKNIELQYIN
jgi:hypothetical protein